MREHINMPNALSLVRVPLAAAFLLATGTAARAAIIVAAGISDWLDGWWARTRGPRTRTGAILDPITDKIFVVAALVAFLIEATLSATDLLVLLARDLFVTIGVLAAMAMRVPLRLQARFPGKVVTTLQILAVLVLTVMPQAAGVLVMATAVAAAWAIVDYARAGLAALRAASAGR